MSALAFSKVDESEQSRVFSTLVMAFAADPVERWLYPEPRQYLLHFPRFLGAFGGRAFAERTVWSLGEFSAVALWLPPGIDADGDGSPPNQLNRSIAWEDVGGMAQTCLCAGQRAGWSIRE